jgi:hypothetical protein
MTTPEQLVESAEEFPVVDWRSRESVCWQDFMDGDRHLVLGVHSDFRIADRGLVNIPHPLKGVLYADGTV